MKVLVTGGAGFIGGHAIEHFTSCGDEVINVDKLTYAASSSKLNLCRFVHLDVSDRQEFQKLLSEVSPDYVVHFAAETHVDNSIKSYEDFVKSNVEGAASVALTCSNLGIKLCHISTDEVYGPAGDEPFSEEDRLNPMNPYSATKAAGDMLVKSFHNTYKLQYVIVRPSNNYGPHQHQEKFIPKLLKSIQEGNKFPLYGNGSQVREWTYVKDTVAIIRKLLLEEKDWCSTYNVTSNISMTNNEVIEAVLKLHHKNITRDEIIEHVIDRKGHDKKYSITAEKIHRVVQHTYVDFVSGMQEILDGE
jgi:dTDP-glucose 4,6-dehydratase